MTAPSLSQNPLTFAPSSALTLGVEVELQIIDQKTLNLAPKANELLDATQHITAIKPELYLDMLEINTSICTDAHQAHQELQDSLSQLRTIATPMGLTFATSGSHPLSHYNTCDIYPSPGYIDLIDRNQWLTRRWKVYGLHVHIGMESGDECIRYNNFFIHLLPHLLALSASAPFWQSEDTGLATCRPTIYESMPTSGLPTLVKNWQEFSGLVDVLSSSRAITSLKDLWWDIRPSPRFGTLEIRVCDGTATLAETVAITAFIHMLGHWFRDHASWITEVPSPPHWLMRENKWRVIRHGLDADLVTSPDGTSRPLREDILDWLEKLTPYS